MKEILKSIIRPTRLNLGLDIAIAIPRIFYGYLLTFEFGSPKFGMPWTNPDKNLGLFEVAFWFPHEVENYGGVFALMPVFLAWMAGFSEAVGGLAWMVGFQTRIFSFLIFCTMMVVVFIHQFQYGYWNMMPGMGILWIAFINMITGSGLLGIDNLISKKI
jgi:putative oxidoreductase